LSRLIKKTGDTGDKRTWYIGGKEVNQGQDAERYKGFGRRKGKEAGVEDAAEEENGAATVPVTASTSNGGGQEDVMASLAGLDLGSPSVSMDQPSNSVASESTLRSPVAASSPTTSTKPLLAATSPSPLHTPTARKQVTHGTEKWLSRLVYNMEGVLYEDAQLQVGVKSEFQGHLGRIQIYFGNKLPVALESFTATVDVEDPDSLAVTLPKIPSPHVSAMSQIQQLVHVECKQAFSTPPLLNISYLAGSLQTITLRLPVWVSKFLEPVKLDSGAFFERWKQIGGPPREAQKIFKIQVEPNSGVDVGKQQRVVGGVKMGLLPGVDPNPTNTVAAGVLHTSKGKVGCLLRMEPNEKAKVSSTRPFFFRFWLLLTLSVVRVAVSIDY
jgi:AP-2 complex subunit alpha